MVVFYQCITGRVGYVVTCVDPSTNSDILCSCAEYCGTFCYPNVAQSPYLRTVGEKLLPGIEVLWTGKNCWVWGFLAFLVGGFGFFFFDLLMMLKMIAHKYLVK